MISIFFTDTCLMKILVKRVDIERHEVVAFGERIGQDVMILVTASNLSTHFVQILSKSI